MTTNNKRILLYLTVIFHIIVFITMLLCLIGLAINFIWYISIPLGVFIINMTNNGTCILNTIEKRLRKELHMPTIHGFLNHYIITPLFRFIMPYNERFHIWATYPLPKAKSKRIRNPRRK